jgi:hypothetical protein
VGEVLRPYKATIGLSEDSMSLLSEHDIKNLSAFVDELIIEALQDKKFWGKKFVYFLEEARKCAKKAGIEDKIEI